MQTLKLSVSLPDDSHPEMELRLSASDASCDVVIALPLRPHDRPAPVAVPGTAARDTTPLADVDRSLGTSASKDHLLGTSTGVDHLLGTSADDGRKHGADDEYVLGGYAGI